MDSEVVTLAPACLRRWAINVGKRDGQDPFV